MPVRPTFYPLVILPAAAIFVVFALAFSGTGYAVSHGAQVQRELRAALFERARLLKTQLDEETGMRGYTATRDPQFLQPYTAATAAFDTDFREARAIFTIVAPEALVALDDERLTHERWVSAVAGPLIANPSRPDAARLQLEGKRLIDHFREDDGRTLAALEGAGDAADATSRSLVNTIVVAGFFIGFGLVLYVLWSGERERTLQSEVAKGELLYEQERQIVDTLQAALLPAALPAAAGATLNARYRPAGEAARIGGDWYDAYLLPDGRLFIVIGDITGHGISATATMSQARRAIIGAGLQLDDPGEILTRANAALERAFSRQPMIGTAICAIVTPSSGEIAYANAGHPPPALVTVDGHARILEYGDLPLGVRPEHYRTRYARAEAESTLILYTDGLTEARHDPIDGENRLLESARRIAGARLPNPAAALEQEVLGESAVPDDVAILTITFGGFPENAAGVAPSHDVRGVLPNVPRGALEKGDAHFARLRLVERAGRRVVWTRHAATLAAPGRARRRLSARLVLALVRRAQYAEDVRSAAPLIPRRLSDGLDVAHRQTLATGRERR